MTTTTSRMTIKATRLSVPPRRADTLFGQTPTVASEWTSCDRCPAEMAKVKVIYVTGPLILLEH